MNISFPHNPDTKQDLSSQVDGYLKKTESLFLLITATLQVYVSLNEDCHESIINAKNSLSNRITNIYLPENNNCNAIAETSGENDPIEEMIETIPNLVNSVYTSLFIQHYTLGNGMESNEFATLLTRKVVRIF